MSLFDVQSVFNRDVRQRKTTSFAFILVESVLTLFIILDYFTSFTVINSEFFVFIALLEMCLLTFQETKVLFFFIFGELQRTY